eukprot:CAMPEP_0198131594 /NCGR_PEP_ID=MMETSP1442-20131203/56530_1 /TAXON_ID= /ORGANISM="Craspedostauros australis, Strain CCMP3328" /LENGTH=136 /DNA_ID=CAMNT_0043792441 /DNA_START=369 /DNA_END=780 /DNA_ORIENTATION=+
MARDTPHAAPGESNRQHPIEGEYRHCHRQRCLASVSSPGAQGLSDTHIRIQNEYIVDEFHLVRLWHRIIKQPHPRAAPDRRAASNNDSAETEAAEDLANAPPLTGPSVPHFLVAWPDLPLSLPVPRFCDVVGASSG